MLGPIIITLVVVGYLAALPWLIKWESEKY
jgi:hypothetical protein